MCNPVAIAAAIKIAGSVMEYSDQKHQADQQTLDITRNYELQRSALNQQNHQLSQQAQENMSQRAKESWIEEGRLKAAMGESGLQAGGTDTRIMGEAQNNATYDISTIENNRAKSAEQVHSQGVGIQAETQSRYNAVRRPSLIGTGLQIVGVAAEGKKIQDDAVRNALYSVGRK